jgi:hypothetical protein
LAGEAYDVERQGETWRSTAGVALEDGSTFINSALSRDGQKHDHPGHLEDYIPTAPYDLSLRCHYPCDADGHVPQIQFNENGVWHDFNNELDGGAALYPVEGRGGPWFPFLALYPSASAWLMDDFGALAERHKGQEAEVEDERRMEEHFDLLADEEYQRSGGEHQVGGRPGTRGRDGSAPSSGQAGL